MGCIQAAQCTSETAESGCSMEERVVCRFEDALLFQRHSAKKLSEALENCARKGKIFQSTFYALLREMGLCVQGLEEASSPLMVFYGHFREGNGFESMRLKLLAALLTRGEAKEKAEVMFDAVASGQAKIDVSVLADLIDILLNISANVLPVFAVRPEEGGLSQKSCVSLSLRLERQKETVRDRLINQILECRKSMNREEFVTRVETEESLRSMLTSKGLRRLLQTEMEIPLNCTAERAQ